MAYLNAQERTKLAEELVEMPFNRAKGHLRRIDPKNRMAFFRNAQSPTQLHTRYDLPTLGTRVTMVESMTEKDTKKSGVFTSEFKILHVIVEALPDNHE